MTTLDKELQDYIALTSGSSVKELCAPILKKHSINYFLYIRAFPDGNRLWLTNRGDWTRHYYEHQHYHHSPFEIPKADYKRGYYLWKTLPSQETFCDARRYFDIDHGITVVHHLEDCTEFSHFGTSTDQHDIYNFYLNNMDFLNQFILYFRDRGQDLISLAHKKMIQHPPIIHSDTSLITPGSREMLFDELKLTKKILSAYYNHAHFTYRELDCIKYLKQGFNATDTASFMGISSRTVEIHIKNIKEKLSCENLLQLGYKLAEIDLYKN